MEIPRPTPFHKKLVVLIGSWSGEEKLAPAPWDPVGGEAQGRITVESLFDGMYLMAKYDHIKDGRIQFQGLGLYGYDIRHSLYTMYWFDSFGFDPRGPATGNWVGNSLILDQKDEFGLTRYVYTFNGEDELQMEIQIGQDEPTFQEWLRGTYKRTGR